MQLYKNPGSQNQFVVYAVQPAFKRNLQNLGTFAKYPTPSAKLCISPQQHHCCVANTTIWRGSRFNSAIPPFIE